MKKLIIAIDGPAGAGKSTVSKALANRLGYTYIDTGAMYRALAWKVLQSGLPLEDEKQVTELAQRAMITLHGKPDHLRVFIDNEDVTEAIRTERISDTTSRISTYRGVRRAMVVQQRRLGQSGGVVLEGRDIGTRVFPEADAKFYLDADPKVRAERRRAEEHARGREVTHEQALQEVEARDRRDEEREDSPLRQAKDAIHIDSTDQSVEQVIEALLAFITRRQ